MPIAAENSARAAATKRAATWARADHATTAIEDNMGLLLGASGDGKQEVTRLLQEARDHFAHRNQRKTIDALHAAQQVATAHGLHAEASQLRRALTILGSGGSPKLLRRGELKGGQKDETGD
jgi:hypothetical protein